MTWSRLLGGTWVLIWWIWELTESTLYCAWYCQMLQVNQLYRLLYIPLIQACHADKKHTRTALAAVDFGQLLSNTKMEAQRTRSWRGLLPSADTSLRRASQDLYRILPIITGGAMSTYPHHNMHTLENWNILIYWNNYYSAWPQPPLLRFFSMHPQAIGVAGTICSSEYPTTIRTFILVKCATANYDHKLGIGFLKSPNHLRTLKHVVVPEAYQDSPE